MRCSPSHAASRSTRARTPELNDIVAGLRSDAEMWAVRQDERSRKLSQAASYYELKSRAPMGEAMRRSR